jgi:hypothetical protein
MCVCVSDETAESLSHFPAQNFLSYASDFKRHACLRAGDTHEKRREKKK